MNDGFLYVLLASPSGRVKLGFSRNPECRAKQIGQALPEHVKLCGSFPATQEFERRVHLLFSAARVKGEWYESTAALSAIFDREEQRLDAVDRGILDPRGIA